MVKRLDRLNATFGSLAHPTRRDILMRVAQKELSVTEITKPYNISFAAISKHLKVLEEAMLISRRREGKLYFVQLAPGALEDAAAYLETYRQVWESRLDRLDTYLSSFPKKS